MCQEQAQTADGRVTLKAIWKGIHMVDSYLNSALDFLGGKDRLCQYKCNDGTKLLPCYGYRPSPCLLRFGVHANLSIPSLKKHCNQPGGCCETCGKHKNDWDEFQCCPSKICRDAQKTLGLAQHVQACETTAELLLGNVSLHLGCKLSWTASEPHVCVTRKKKMIFKEDADRWSQQMKTEEHNLWQIAHIFTA